MQFRRRACGQPVSLGVLSATFNPPTKAHLALAASGLTCCDEVLFALSRIFPHKSYEGATLEQRLAMLEAAAGSEPRYSIACTEGGLFVEIVRECRAAYGAAVALRFLCGADAASRVVNWDYGRPGAIREMLQEFELLVAPRRGAFDPPPDLRGRIHPLPLAGEYDEVSATEVRSRIAEGRPWEQLVPESVVPLAREIYDFTTEAPRTQR